MLFLMPNQPCQSTEGKHTEFGTEWVFTGSIHGGMGKSGGVIEHHNTTTTVLRPFFRDHPCEPVPEKNFWTLWCKGRLTETDHPAGRHLIRTKQCPPPPSPTVYRPDALPQWLKYKNILGPRNSEKIWGLL